MITWGIRRWIATCLGRREQFDWRYPPEWMGGKARDLRRPWMLISLRNGATSLDLNEFIKRPEIREQIRRRAARHG